MSLAPESKKIALFVPSFRGGGAERAMILFAEGLLELGHSVDFIVAQANGPLLHTLPANARLIDLSARKVSFAIPALVRYLRRERPDAVYSTVVNANIAAIFARAIARGKMPLIVRESNVLRPTGALTLARRISGTVAPRLYQMADAIISVSKDVAEELGAASPALKSKISVLPNPVVSERILELANAQAEHPWFSSSAPPDDSPIVLGAGRLHPQKDFSTLIDAFSEARKSREMRLIILGEGSERQNLEEQVRRLNLEDSVSLPGYVENPFPYMKKARTFVLSSRYEGMPNVLLQAMALGTPVIATRGSSGAKEVLANPEFGVLVPVGDVPEMARALGRCFNLPKCQSAAKFVNERFSVARATREYLQLAGI